MASVLEHKELSKQVLDEMLHMSFQKKVDTLNTLDASGDWQSKSGVVTADDLIDVILALREQHKLTTFSFVYVTFEEWLRLKEMGFGDMVKAPGFTIFYRVEN